ncbi:MAG: hypothetical protein IPG39_15270 [Bacteroidetes bacterium]|nr:hypothetical protein [Bacteroidota bacterium]
MTDQLEEIRFPKNQKPVLMEVMEAGPPDSIHFFMDPEVHRMEVTPAPTQVATITMDMTPVEVEIQVVVEMVGIRGGGKAKHYTII